ncbi:MAG: hypothetical protein K2R98_30830 [Gemmataceae bacterium]|nr:hypothetical protein [Gemmataceae bacterium]
MLLIVISTLFVASSDGALGKLWVQSQALCIRASHFDDRQKGAMLVKLARLGMKQSEVRSIFGEYERPIILGHGPNCQDHYYLEFGVIISFQDQRVDQVEYVPPHDRNGAPRFH